MTFDGEKLQYCGYPRVKKVKDVLTRFDRIHERDGLTDGRTDGQKDGRTYAYLNLNM